MGRQNVGDNGELLASNGEFEVFIRIVFYSGDDNNFFPSNLKGRRGDWKINRTLEQINK